MNAVAGFGQSIYYFFVEDGSIVIGAVIALIIVGALAIAKPVGSAAEFVGPLLFLLIAAILAVNLLRVARQAARR